MDLERKIVDGNAHENIGRYEYETVDSKSIAKKPYSEILQIIHRYDNEVRCLNKIIAKKDETIQFFQNSVSERSHLEKEISSLKEKNRSVNKKYQEAQEELGIQKEEKISLISEMKFLNDRLTQKQKEIIQLQQQLNKNKQ